MKLDTSLRRAGAWLLCLGVVGLGLGIGEDASAQTIYRTQDANGALTFTDTPVGEPVRVWSGAASGGMRLPFELKTVAGRYPVRLYTSADCAPCRAAAGFLQRRGIPYQELTVSSHADEQALARKTGNTQVPVLTVGEQIIKGYSEVEYASYLDAAGYPKEGRLPRDYVAPPARPIVQIQEGKSSALEPVVPSSSAPLAAPAAHPDAKSIGNRAGITF